MMHSRASRSPIGTLLRDWRAKRRLSQLDLASEAEISQRHLSFVESGRARPSRDMVLRLAEMLNVPLRERNRMLHAAGFAPVFGERPLDDPALLPAMEAVRAVLKGHEPFPSLAVDRHWNVIATNGALAPFFALVAEPALLQPSANVYRLALHPGGLAPHIVNFAEWRSHLLHRLRAQNDSVADPVLIALEQEITAYPAPATSRSGPTSASHSTIAVPLKLKLGGEVLSFLSTVTVFGTPLDVTLAELAVESLFPADDRTGELLRIIAAQRGEPDS
ncbi:helix-turn-helix domain-containing protein [Mesorhizobium sp. NBSH29]|uniref:helix-turn-helix domain-containing protein n=1 Tax=Mesorhizobium sp. NBSH29 TaxID=2654249 RepID=UPI0018966DB6|nr:helix-turn-helix transcriptional regulator [Mesorhizobium sp. NBSH29]QPC87239.1 helix-turn-helix domain-containing protein [Mesorhizobium sp. NBSH29]